MFQQDPCTAIVRMMFKNTLRIFEKTKHRLLINKYRPYNVINYIRLEIRKKYTGSKYGKQKISLVQAWNFTRAEPLNL